MTTIKKSLDIQRENIEEPVDIEGDTRKWHLPTDWKSANITLILLIVAIWSAYMVTRLLSGNPDPKPETFVKESLDASPKESITKEAKTPETASSEEDSTIIPAEEAEKISEKPPVGESEIVKNSFSIRLLNGNGIAGDAAKFKTQLTTAGFKVGTIGNAKLKYDKTQIYHRADKLKHAELVAKSLSDRTTELKEEEDSFIGTGYDILVVIGKI